MTWNYRIVKCRTKSPIKGRKDDIWCGIFEVFYDDKGRPETRTADPIDVTGESGKEVVKVLEMMLADAKKYKVLSDKQIYGRKGGLSDRSKDKNQKSYTLEELREKWGLKSKSKKKKKKGMTDAEARHWALQNIS